jgi:hypothetical protein
MLNIKYDWETTENKGGLIFQFKKHKERLISKYTLLDFAYGKLINFRFISTAVGYTQKYCCYKDDYIYNISWSKIDGIVT